MSNRYVWQRFNLDYEEAQGSPVRGFQDFYWTRHDGTEWDAEQYVGYAPEISNFRSSYVVFQDAVSLTLELYESVTIPAGQYCWIAHSRTNNTASYGKIYKTTAQTTVSGQPQLAGVQPTNPNIVPITFTRVKGTANGTVSNSASSTYPPRDYPSKSARIWPYSAPGT